MSSLKITNLRTLSLPLALVLFLSASCGLIETPAPPPQLSATDLVPRATALSELPPTWTPEPTWTASPTLPPTPSPSPTQDPANYQISLALEAEEIPYSPSPLGRSGWSVMEGDTARISIPPGYEVLDFAGVMMEMMVGIMEAFAEGFTDFAMEMGEELGVTPEATPEEVEFDDLPEFDFLLALEPESQSAIILTSMDRGPETTTEDLINEGLSDSEVEFTPISRQVITGGPYAIERVFLSVEDPDLGPGIQIIYAILSDTGAWTVIFGISETQLEDSLPLFEAVIDSFQPISDF